MSVTTVTRSPTLAAISHGTSSPIGRRAVSRLVAAVAAARVGVSVHEGFVDVQQPDPATLFAALVGDASVVVVPLLLSAGYHVHVDLARDVASSRREASCAAALGPDARLVDVLVRRLTELGIRDDDTVVLVAAGSSDERAVADCRRMSQMLGLALGREVTTGFVSAARPRAANAIAQARAARPGHRVLVANYLLAPGYFAELVAAAGGDLTSAPLLEADRAPDSELVAVVLDRYDAACGTL